MFRRKVQKKMSAEQSSAAPPKEVANPDLPARNLAVHFDAQAEAERVVEQVRSP